MGLGLIDNGLVSCQNYLSQAWRIDFILLFKAFLFFYQSFYFLEKLVLVLMHIKRDLKMSEGFI